MAYQGTNRLQMWLRLWPVFCYWFFFFFFLHITTLSGFNFNLVIHSSVQVLLPRYILFRVFAKKMIFCAGGYDQHPKVLSPIPFILLLAAWRKLGTVCISLHFYFLFSIFHVLYLIVCCTVLRTEFFVTCLYIVCSYAPMLQSKSHDGDDLLQTSSLLNLAGIFTWLGLPSTCCTVCGAKSSRSWPDSSALWWGPLAPTCQGAWYRYHVVGVYDFIETEKWLGTRLVTEQRDRN